MDNNNQIEIKYKKKVNSQETEFTNNFIMLIGFC